MRILLIAGISGLAGLLAYGQAASKLEFEVASIKVNEPPKPGQRLVFGASKGGPGTDDPEHIVWQSAYLRAILMSALDIKPYQLSGPSSMATERYDFAIKVPAGATKDQVKTMWLNLLADRFGMKFHHEVKEFEVDELMAGKDGPKLKRTSADTSDAPASTPPNLVNGELRSVGLVTMFRAAPTGVTAKLMGVGQSMDLLALMLSNELQHPVVDKTGILGRYDFEVDFTPDPRTLPPPPPPPPGGGPPAPPPPVNTLASEPGQPLAAAVLQQLGLRLVKGKAMLDTVIVDRVATVPTEN